MRQRLAGYELSLSFPLHQSETALTTATRTSNQQPEPVDDYIGTAERKSIFFFGPHGAKLFQPLITGPGLGDQATREAYPGDGHPSGQAKGTLLRHGHYTCTCRQAKPTLRSRRRAETRPHKGGRRKEEGGEKHSSQLRRKTGWVWEHRGETATDQTSGIRAVARDGCGPGKRRRAIDQWVRSLCSIRHLDKLIAKKPTRVGIGPGRGTRLS